MSGNFATPQIRQLINQEELWQTVQKIVHTFTPKNSMLCDEPSSPRPQRSAVHVILESITFKQQLELVVQTEIFIHLHGSAGVMSFFLPPGAIYIELRPYKFTWTTWAVELARSNQLTAIDWRNMNASSSSFAHEPYDSLYEGSVLEHFQNMNSTLLCNGHELKKLTHTDSMDIVCQQYYRDQHTVVDVHAVGQLVRNALEQCKSLPGGGD